MGDLIQFLLKLCQDFEIIFWIKLSEILFDLKTCIASKILVAPKFSTKVFSFGLLIKYIGGNKGNLKVREGFCWNFGDLLFDQNIYYS